MKASRGQANPAVVNELLKKRLSNAQRRRQSARYQISESDSGEPFQLSKLKGKKVVLYFYPRPIRRAARSKLRVSRRHEEVRQEERGDRRHSPDAAEVAGEVQG
jgi:hypothetical protein